MKEAQFWKSAGNNAVQCGLCPRLCTVGDGQRGFCRVRENHGGVLYSMAYGRPCAINVDPVEKKPLFHFAPGTQCLSIATVGCNLDCGFCQNWDISHPSDRLLRGLGSGSTAGKNKGSGFDSIPSNKNTADEFGFVEPEAVVEMAKENGVPGIAYTYTEPTVFFEYALDIMKLARKAGLYNVWVSNGYTSPAPAKKAARYMDAINVDLKGDVAFYKSLCAVPDEKPMHRALKIYKEAGVWIEVTTLVIPGKNDTPKAIEGIVGWVKKNLGVSTPMHFSRFFPHFRLKDIQLTPVETLEMAAGIAKGAGMKYVYVGNVSGEGENTYCSKCGSIVIERRGYDVKYKRACPKCNTKARLSGLEWLR
jgi:pyruvate formate lyase activating enzyme